MTGPLQVLFWSVAAAFFAMTFEQVPAAPYFVFPVAPAIVLTVMGASLTAPLVAVTSAMLMGIILDGAIADAAGIYTGSLVLAAYAIAAAVRHVRLASPVIRALVATAAAVSAVLSAWMLSNLAGSAFFLTLPSFARWCALVAMLSALAARFAFDSSRREIL